MTAPDDPDDDMRYFPWRSRADIPQVGDGALDALLAPDPRPEETAAPLRPVTEVLAALRAAPSGGELAGLDQALAEFRETARMSGASGRSRPRRPALLRILLSAKLAAAAAAALSGGIAAAYAGALPTALQRFAHDSIAAPAARSSPSMSPSMSPSASHRTATPAGPNPAGPAAYGLCTAYQHAEAHGNATQRAVAFRKLAAAAGGADQVAAYCATVSHPGARPSAKPDNHAAGHPQPPASHRKGKPASKPHGKPSGVPGSGRRP